MPAHTLTRTNAPAWLHPPLWVEVGPEDQHCWRGLVRERVKVYKRQRKKDCKREMARQRDARTY